MTASNSAQGFTVTLLAGQPFPAFTGTSHEGESIDFSKYAEGKSLVVFFYPKATTNGCVRETTEFGARRGELDALNAAVVGVSIDEQEAQKQHAIQCAANFPVITDAGGKLITELGIMSERGSAMRTTYVLSPDRTVREVFEKVNIDGHVDAVLAALKG